MTGIKYDADEGGIGMSEEGGDFVGGFDDAGTMMMEGTGEPATLIDGMGNLGGNGAGVGEDGVTTRRVDAAGVGGAIGVTAVVICQNNQWLMGLTEDLRGAGQELGGTLGVHSGSGDLGRCPLECHGDKGTNQCQLALLECGSELDWVGRHKAPIAEFSAGIAGGEELVEHLGGGDTFTAEAGKFEGTPRTRGIGNRKSGHGLNLLVNG